MIIFLTSEKTEMEIKNPTSRKQYFYQRKYKSALYEIKNFYHIFILNFIYARKQNGKIKQQRKKTVVQTFQILFLSLKG